MKRLVLITAVAAATAVPAAAAADAGGLTASRGGANLQVNFTFVNDAQGDPRTVRNFQFSGFTVGCNNGTIHLEGFKPRMAVNADGEFSGGITEGRGTVLIEGDFRRNNTVIVGSLEASGRFGTAKGCQGRANWKALVGG